MKATTFDTEKANRIENAVCSEFGFSVSEVVSFRDAIAKKVVVFLLVKYLGLDKRMVGKMYQMSYLYVPTVVAEMEQMEKVVLGFENKINGVLKLIQDA